VLRKIFIAFLLLINSILVAQEAIELQGIVKDSASIEALAFAAVTITPINKGLATDENGKFNIILPKGEYTLQISFLGYTTLTKTIILVENTSLVFYLNQSSVTVVDVTVSSKRDDENIRSNQVGVLKLDSKEISKLPTLMGEPDIINAIRLTPGVQGVGEGNPGLYIRGGDAGQNLFLLDNMPLYNPSHLLGFFPVFNSDIIDNALIIKGGIPAQYGGKASSVIDISMKQGNNSVFAGSGSIGLLSSDLTVESPINKGKGSIIISGRRTYLNVLKSASQAFTKSSNNFFNKTDYFFYDASLKFTYKLTNKTRIYLTAFGGEDLYNLTDSEFDISNKMNWVNACAAVRLNHAFTEKLLVNVVSSKTMYNFNIDAGFDKYFINLFSGIDDWNNSLDFTFLRKPKLPLKFGLVYSKHILTPNKVDVNAGEVNFNNASQYHSNEMAAYMNADFNVSTNLTFSGGLRTSYFQHIGPYTHYSRNEFGQLSDSTVFAKNESVKGYFTADPNFKWVYLLNKTSSIKGSLSMAHQFIHLASVGSVSLPTDVWLPSTQYIKPQRVSQITAGYFRNFLENTYETSVELYFKKMENQVDFLNGVLDNFDNTKIEENIIFGTGMAFGAEFFIKKKIGTTTGWISYTLSKTIRKFDEINNSAYFPAKYDRVHDFSFTINHQLNKKWDISAVFVYATGNAMTLPAGRYLIQGNVANHYTNVNSFRMPAYHRIDISANYKFKKIGRVESWLNLSLYNAYNHANPYFMYFQVKGDLDNYYLSVSAKQISLFPILPSVTWTFKF
jgi:hypothetical protein